MSATLYSPGSIVSARGREWIVLSGSTPETLRLRPVLGSEEDQTTLHIALEPEPVTEARFPWPEASQKAGHEAALLLRDALLLSLRRGAGPFRGFGQIAVEPRAYQLVPLLMALKLDPVRLLIADDVGVGKTIEAGLIARELLDRGDIDRLAVLCPPHLVDQWVTELQARFHLRPVAVTAATARRLDSEIPQGSSIFGVHKHTVVSLDYIKSDARRALFLESCPEFVIVDEAHTCAAPGRGRHQRYELLRGLAEDAERHLVLLTATPHSGDEAAFYRLLGLLDPEFEQLSGAEGDAQRGLREKLARHFVQRRRADIEEWNELSFFPRRETKELTYELKGAWQQFFDDVLDYCASVVESGGGDERRRRLNFWGTLALMRCVASSPAAGAQALRTRAGLGEAESEEDLEDRIFDGASDSLPDDDVEPAVATDDPQLQRLIAAAERLAGQKGDPKLELVAAHVRELLDEGFSPVVFCRYIATAHHLKKQLAARFPNVTTGVVTGELTSEERRDKVAELGDAERRLLIATDCLSEGVNLQEHFDAVVHYDLSWNPTRHEQREGRVDRFGQNGPIKGSDGKTIVRATLLYGANNPVDGAVLEVILRKAEKIRKELGVLVPLPDDGHTLTQALMKAVLLRRRDQNRTLDFEETLEARAIDSGWRDAAERAKRNRTVFAQRRMKPEEVLPEWDKALASIGKGDDVERFTKGALARLGSALEPLKRRGYKTPLDSLPEDIRERLEAEGLAGTLLLDFTYPPAPRCRPVQRSHPLVSTLAEALLERTLEANGDADPRDRGVLGRVGCWISADVAERTTVALLRLRHQLTTHRGRNASTLHVEEAAALAWVGASAPRLLAGEAALALLAPAPAGDPPAPVRDREVARALEMARTAERELDEFARRRAEALLADHRRVREAADARGSYSVTALLPPDVVALFVLLPRVA